MSEKVISIPADMDLNDLKAGIYKCEAYENWKSEHLQQPISYLTEENLDWLEQHCEKTIEHATRNTLKEHLMVLELIKEHKNYLSMREDYLRRMKASNEVLRKQGYISKDKIKEKIKELVKQGDYRTAENPNGRVHFHKEPVDYQLEILKELLEEV